VGTLKNPTAFTLFCTLRTQTVIKLGNVYYKCGK